MSTKPNARPYPHARDDCDVCGDFDADLAARYPELELGRDQRWCHRCAGQVLTKLVADGQVVSVRSIERADTDDAKFDAPPAWTVDMAERVLRLAKPSGSVFLRALIDEGGAATAQRMRELTNTQALQYMTLTLNHAARNVVGRGRLPYERHLVLARSNPETPRSVTVYDYTLPTELVPLFDEALRRLGR